MENYDSLKLFFWMGSAVMVLLAFLVIAITLYHQNRMLKIQRVEALLRMKAVLKKEQDERLRIASDLHDSVCGDLAAIRISLSLLENENVSPEFLELVRETSEEISNTQAEIRRISFNLMPPNLLQSGFLPSLKDLLRRNGERNLFKYTLNAPDNLNFSDTASYQILQILAELISNSSKHGKCDFINIQLIRSNTATEINYSDNGTSYDFYKNASESLGLGLRNIIFRMQTLNGIINQHKTQTGNSLVMLIPHEN